MVGGMRGITAIRALAITDLTDGKSCGGSVSSTLECTLPLQSNSPVIVDPSDGYFGFPLDFSNYLLAEINIEDVGPEYCPAVLSPASPSDILLVGALPVVSEYIQN